MWTKLIIQKNIAGKIGFFRKKKISSTDIGHMPNIISSRSINELFASSNISNKNQRRFSKKHPHNCYAENNDFTKKNIGRHWENQFIEWRKNVCASE